LEVYSEYREKNEVMIKRSEFILLIFGNVLLSILMIITWWFQPLIPLVCATCSLTGLIVVFVSSVFMGPFVLFLLKKVSFIQLIIIVVGTVFLISPFINFMIGGFRILK